MANFQVIFSGNEDELYRFIITWKMMTDSRKYEEQVKQLQGLEERLKEAREELRELESRKRSLEREISELMAVREALKRELSAMRESGAVTRGGEAGP